MLRKEISAMRYQLCQGVSLEELDGNMVIITEKGDAATLNETGSLKESIVWRRASGTGNKRSVIVYTNPLAFKGEKRNKRGICYAAIHNEGGKIANPGSPASYIRQRQFIGYSTTVADKISSYSIRIFDGFPK